MFTGMKSKAAPASDTELVKMLRAGGLVIVLRHGATFPDQADTDPLNFDNLAAQRHLNAKGEAAAKALGEALSRIGVPVGKVYTSKFDRAYQTAVLAGLTRIEKTADVTEGGLVVSPNENSRRAKAFLTLLATVPEPNTNTINITHKPNIVDALGKDWLDVKRAKLRFFGLETEATSWSRACRWMNGSALRNRDDRKSISRRYLKSTRRRLAEFALRHRAASIFAFREWAQVRRSGGPGPLAGSLVFQICGERAELERLRR
jgi:phosphohistidine phosphatase SixA